MSSYSFPDEPRFEPLRDEAARYLQPAGFVQRQQPSAKLHLEVIADHGDAEAYTLHRRGSTLTIRADGPRGAAHGFHHALRFAKRLGIDTGFGFELDGDPTTPGYRQQLARRIRHVLEAYPDLHTLCLWESEGQGVYGWQNFAASPGYPALHRRYARHFRYLAHVPCRQAEGVRLAALFNRAYEIAKEIRPAIQIAFSGWGGDKWMRWGDYWRGLHECLPAEVTLAQLDNLSPRWQPGVSEAVRSLTAGGTGSTPSAWGIESGRGGTRPSNAVSQGGGTGSTPSTAPGRNAWTALWIEADSGVLVTMDVCAIGARTISQYILNDSADDFLPRLRQRVERELGIPGGQVSVSASHTHPPGRLLCDDDAQLDRTIAAIQQALVNMIPVTLGTGAGHENTLTINRTMVMKNGTDYYWRPEPPGNEIEKLRPIDPEIGILRIDRLDGSPLAVVYNFICRPMHAATTRSERWTNRTGWTSRSISRASARWS